MPFADQPPSDTLESSSRCCRGWRLTHQGSLYFDHAGGLDVVHFQIAMAAGFIGCEFREAVIGNGHGACG
ncbi:MAG: hypothetical protein H6821_02725 [Planctomycetaceae bacterium]|nr:hypothetical protein [Planctomycetaceae bacterium]